MKDYERDYDRERQFIEDMKSDDKSEKESLNNLIKNIKERAKDDDHQASDLMKMINQMKHGRDGITEEKIFIEMRKDDGEIRGMVLENVQKHSIGLADDDNEADYIMKEVIRRLVK